MTTWIAFLRGINVGGNNVLPMKDLVTLLEKIGCHDVKTYIQSGNAVFRSAESNSGELAARIGETVLDECGFQPRTFVLNSRELKQAVESNPFPAAEPYPKTLHLYFLSERPDNVDIDSLNEVRIDSESFVLTDMVFYLHAPEGIGRSKLAERVERSVGVDVTARNWRTVSRVFEIAEQYE